ncbi:MAG: hypothetical protein IRZ00_10375 [Gemmatimonadetes bacterium]|nr:hypothetical protein [Gemmatimonadota bacterium]
MSVVLQRRLRAGQEEELPVLFVRNDDDEWEEEEWEEDEDDWDDEDEDWEDEEEEWDEEEEDWDEEWDDDADFDTDE